MAEEHIRYLMSLNSPSVQSRLEIDEESARIIFERESDIIESITGHRPSVQFHWDAII